MNHDCTTQGHRLSEPMICHSLYAYRVACTECGTSSMAVVIEARGWSGGEAQQEIEEETKQRAIENFHATHSTEISA